MRFAVILNPDGVATETLEKLNTTLSALDIVYDCVSLNDKNADFLIETSDLVLALGGDGTIIHTAKRAALSGKKVLGINCGHLGYNAGLEIDELDMLTNLKTGEYKTDRRMMLKVTIDDAVYYCVNDAVVCKGALSRMIKITTHIGGAVMNYRSDGLIFSTPTGSTAYSLSAGGPIIDPTLQSVVITPICAHSLFDRPLVINPDTEIVVTIDEQSGNDTYLTIDGETAVPLNSKSKVVIERSEITADIIKIKNDGFLQILKQKIK